MFGYLDLVFGSQYYSQYTYLSSFLTQALEYVTRFSSGMLALVYRGFLLFLFGLGGDAH